MGQTETRVVQSDTRVPKSSTKWDEVGLGMTERAAVSALLNRHTNGPPPVHAPLARRIAAFDHDGLDLTRAVAAEGRGAVVFGRGEAGDALLEGRELDHHEAVEFCRPFHDLIATAAREHLAAELGNDGRHEVRVLLVFDRIIDLRPRNPIGRHGDVLARVSVPTSGTLGAPGANRKRRRLLPAKGW